MSRGGTFAAIDVGTTKICTVVGEVTREEDMRILGVGIGPSAGLSKGMVENIRDATESIKTSVEKAERSSGTRILSAHVGIAGAHIACLNNRGIVAIPDRSRPIMPDDVTRVLDGARVVSIPTNREIIHVIPRYYVVDGLEVGVDGAIWLFDSPTIGTLTPQIKYVVHQLPLIKPYIGTFYRHYFVGDDFEDLDSVGARVGIYIVSNQGAYFGVGGLYEHMLDCNENVLECDDWYPELLVGISF